MYDHRWVKQIDALVDALAAVNATFQPFENDLDAQLKIETARANLAALFARVQKAGPNSKAGE